MTEKERPDLPSSVPPPFRIEDCLVQPALNRIECGQETHQIEPRVMQVLICLAARPNEVLSRQTLFDVVWADSVVCEEALTRTISELRRVFRDDTKTPRVIETIRKGGYRLIAPVTPATSPPPSPSPPLDQPPSPSQPRQVLQPPQPSPSLPPGEPLRPFSSPLPTRSLPSEQQQPLPQPTPSPPPPDPPLPPRRPSQASVSRVPVRSGMASGRRIGIFSLAVAALLSLTVWGASRFTRSAHETSALMEPRPLTAFPGLELFPVLSPDGSMVAFSWAGENPVEGNPLDIYVMKVRNGSPVRLTNLPGSEGYPAWSPDGTEIAFYSDAMSEHAICTVPVLGGSIRRMTSVEATAYGLDWSPDGRTIVYAAEDASGAISRIHLLSLETLSRRDLPSPPPHCPGDIEPAFSPDGRAVAFIRINELQGRDAYLVSTEGGEARKVDMGGKRVSGVAWLSQKELIISAASRSDYGLWRAPVDFGEPTRLPMPEGRMQRVSTARVGRGLAYEKLSFVRNIWCMDVSRMGEFRRRPGPLIASTLRDSEPVFSPDGRSIAFVSDRSGAPEIWIADTDGGNQHRLTDHQATQMTRPRWSPDGSQIAYSCNADGPSSIYVAQVQAQVARKLLPGGPQILACWSRHGDDLYYLVDAAGGWEVWRVHPDGSGSRRISEAGYTIIDETTDGKGLLCLKAGEPGIWRLPVDGGERSLVVSEDRCRGWREIIAANDGLYFLRQERESSTLGFYDYAIARSDSLASLDWYAASPAFSPDRSMLLYDCKGKIEIDLMVAEVPE